MCNGWWDNINKHILFSTPRAVGKNKLYFMIWAGCGGCTGFSFAFVRNFLRTVWYDILYFVCFVSTVFRISNYTYVCTFHQFWLNDIWILPILKKWTSVLFHVCKRAVSLWLIRLKNQNFGVDSYAIERVGGYHRIENDRFFKTFRTVLSAVVPNSSVTFPLSFSQKIVTRPHQNSVMITT